MRYKSYPLSIYHCIIPHESEPYILALEGESGLSLPQVKLASEWLPEAVGFIAQEINSQLGLKVTVLRHLQDGIINICEMENHSPDWKPPDGARWINQDMLPHLKLAATKHLAVLKTWFAETETAEVPSLRPEWERRGWFDEAVAWIRLQLDKLGSVPTGPVEQVKAAWGRSTVLRIPTGKGYLYFKAVNLKPPFEAAVISALAGRWPENFPLPLAIDYQRRWMLMPDLGGTVLRGMSADCWAGAVRLFAQIQVACAADVASWLALGCPDYRLDQTRKHIDLICNDTGAIFSEQLRNTVGAAVSKFCTLAPGLKEQCARLANYSIPPTLVNQDFRHDNLVVTDKNFVYFDWSDAVVGHPFFSATRFLNYASLFESGHGESSSDILKRKIRDAYLEPWAAYGSQDYLLQAFELTQRLEALYLTLRWHLELPYLEPGSVSRGEIEKAFARQLLRVLKQFSNGHS